MVIETRLSKEQFLRLSIWRHIQRRTFYFYALMCAGITAYALVQGPRVLLLVAWVPFLLYLLFGIIGAFRDSADKDSPLFLPTRYEFTPKGVSVSTDQGSSQLNWEHFSGWKVISKCYVLMLSTGPILAIPKASISITQIPKFESLLRQHIG